MVELIQIFQISNDDDDDDDDYDNDYYYFLMALRIPVFKFLLNRSSLFLRGSTPYQTHLTVLETTEEKAIL